MSVLVNLIAAAAVAVAPAAPLSAPRAAHSATLLQNGTVLVAGGCTLPGCDDVAGQTATTEIYDPATKAFHPGPDMTRPRVSQAAIRLPNGDVLIAAGYSGTASPLDVETYDPTANRFRTSGHLLGGHGDGAVVRLRDGRVLFAGGFDATGVTDHAELFDPRTGESRSTGSLTVPRAIMSATVLRDGRVLLAGGSTRQGRVLSSAELYDPRTGRFTRTKPLHHIRYKHGAALLENGRVLIVGGAARFDLNARYSRAEIYDPKTNSFTLAATSRAARYHVHDAVAALPHGKVLVAGDGSPVELYDPATRRFRLVGRLGESLGFATVTVLRDGRALVVGGYTDLGEIPSTRTWLVEP